MANYKEVGLGIATALASGGTNPLPIVFKGQELAEAARIVLAVVDECRDAGIALARVELSPDLHAAVQAERPTSEKIACNPNLHTEARFFFRAGTAIRVTSMR